MSQQTDLLHGVTNFCTKYSLFLTSLTRYYNMKRDNSDLERFPGANQLQNTMKPHCCLKLKCLFNLGTWLDYCRLSFKMLKVMSHHIVRILKTFPGFSGSFVCVYSRVPMMQCTIVPWIFSYKVITSTKNVLLKYGIHR